MKINRAKKTCGKVQYNSKAQAAQAFNGLKHTGVKHYYKCNFHDKEVWHLTSRLPKYRIGQKNFWKHLNDRPLSRMK